MHQTMIRPVVREVRFFLAHTPGLVRHGWKPSRETAHDTAFWEQARPHLRSHADALTYAPHQVLLGNLAPDALADLPQPWYDHPLTAGRADGPHGDLVGEEEFFGQLKLVDSFDFVWLEEGVASRMRVGLQGRPFTSPQDAERLTGVPFSQIEAKLADPDDALPLALRDGQVVGLVRRRLEEDPALAADILLENLLAKATASMALRALLAASGTPADRLQYLIGSGEEAIGDRYNRGGGNLAKAVAEATGCQQASGFDVKAFCTAPVYAMIVAGSLISAGAFQQVAVVGGGSLAKLGMKAPGHLAKGMPILEDLLVGFAVLLGPDDGRSPVLRLDSVGRHSVGAGGVPQRIMEALIQQPLEGLGLRFSDIGKYPTEMHNPEITDTVGNGDVPRTNYRLIAALAAKKGEIGPGAAEAPAVAQRPLEEAMAHEVAGLLQGLADQEHGGYGFTSKFPDVEAAGFLLHDFEATGDRSSLAHALKTLNDILRGKLHDPQDGGFFRNSSKPDWSEPHREKLLRGQVGLLQNLLHAFLLTEAQEYRSAADETIGYLNARLTDPDTGAFYGCEDHLRPERTPGAEGTPRWATAVDRCVYVDANAAAVCAYLDAGWILGRPDCVERALRALEFLWQRCREAQGGMYHYLDGEAAGPGLLRDQVGMGAALLAASRTAETDRFMAWAEELAEEVLASYRNPVGGFYDIREPGDAYLRFRRTPLQENSDAAAFLMLLSRLSGEEQYEEAARWALEPFKDTFHSYGVAGAAYGSALRGHLAPPLWVTLEGSAGDPQLRALARAALVRLGRFSLVLRIACTSSNPLDPREQPRLSLGTSARKLGPVTDIRELTPQRVAALWMS